MISVFFHLRHLGCDDYALACFGFATLRGRVNLYGPPLHIPETRGLKELTKRAATLGQTQETDYLYQYKNFPQHASTYRGRVMIVERIVDTLPKKREKETVCLVVQ